MISSPYCAVLLSTLMFINIIKGHSMLSIRIDVHRYEPHTLSLRPFKFFFQQLHWFLQLQSCFIKWYEKERSIKLRPLRIHNDGCFETLNLPHVSSCEMFTFCDVVHQTNKKMKNANKLLRMHRMDWKSSVNVALKVDGSHVNFLTDISRCFPVMVAAIDNDQEAKIIQFHITKAVSVSSYFCFDDLSVLWQPKLNSLH